MKNITIVLIIFLLLNCKGEKQKENTVSYFGYETTVEELNEYIKDPKLTDINKFPLKFQKAINILIDYYNSKEKNPEYFYVDKIKLENDSILLVSTLHLRGYLYFMNLKENDIPISGNASGEDRFFHIDIKNDSIETVSWYQ